MIFRNRIAKLLRHDVAIVALSTAAAHVMSISAAPFLSRIYGPQPFGTLQMYTSVLGFLLTVACCRYETAIFLPENEEDAADVVLVAIITATVVALLSAGLVRLVFPTGGPGVAACLLIPAATFAAGSYQALSTWFIRRRQFSDLARARIGQGITLVGVQLSFGFALPSAPGLVIGDALSRFAGSGWMACRALSSLRSHRVTLARLKKAAYTYRSFPAITTPSTILNSGIALMPLCLGRFYGTEMIGLYSIVDRVLAAPTTFIGQAISQVYMSRVSLLLHREPEQLRSLYAKIVCRLLLIGVVPATCIALAGPRLFVFAFGAAWAESGVYARIMAISSLLSFTAGPVSSTLSLLNAQRVQLGWDAGRTLAVFAGVWIAFVCGASGTEALVVYSAIMSIGYVAQLWLGWIVTNRFAATPKVTSDVGMPELEIA